MKFTYENQGTNTYLVYSVGEDVLDNMSVGMLTANHIEGFLPTTFTQLNAEKFIKYDVSAKLSAKEFLTGAVTKKRLLGVFSGICRAYFSAEEYMLDPSSIVMDLAYMFSDVSTGDTSLICLPIVQTDAAPVQPAVFFKTVLSNIQCDQTENCDYFAKIFNYLNGSGVFSLEDFRSLLDTLAKEGTPPPAYSAGRVGSPIAAPSAPSRPIVPPPIAPKQPSVPPQPSVPMPQGMPPRPASAPAPMGGMPPVPPSPQGRSIQQGGTQPKIPPNGNEAQPEQKVSFLYLMQHYNKENAAAYKAQKDAKKQKNPAAPAEVPVPAFGFAIPGQETPAVQPAPMPTASAPAPAPQPAASGQPTAPAMPRPAAPASPVSASGSRMNFGDTVAVDNAAMNGTVVIGAMGEQEKSPCLIRQKNKEKVALDKPLVRIGRVQDFVDYCIADNPAISRCHASIFNRGGVCAIVDNNSANHTYVNGVMLQSNSEMQLKEGDKVRLGNEEFAFTVC